ncbi:MAG: uracil-DNA glycosylase [Candidatus Vogelbacteria bacterium CG10_big_fil_rev_8_21_14_0_10_49_38]|uniref:Type-4 uracil-DNA glycosylase n=1 Tax=Candidatus Vogelbacteria bacterium CG10_big_fil_rev_8_21_14_0_10_49_38 TaxID=1975043 RepID=A0A2H0RI52_9BACT|nr:MAG: hypothetical protein BK006_00960 [bacterium CG10_49_38]PIR46242.1 MAG: uracil-DNA glycosylase [Candidatus Vogelbacteria bacterium CG10_big_fil_rev_8_21_14_0_10_49_38]
MSATKGGLNQSPSERDRALERIKLEVLNLTESPLYAYRSANKYWPVIGEGSHEARIMLVGEAPGKNEALTGRPFCGAAGKILDELLAGIKLKREEIYIANILKDRPPANRDPLPAEIEIYGPFLDRQIALIQPAVIATLGRYSMGYVMEKFDLVEPPSSPWQIGQLHGRELEGLADYGAVRLVPLYHPAAAIYNRRLLETLRQDFKILANYQ